VGFSLPLHLRFNFVVETSASGDNTSCSSAPDSDLTSIFLILTSFRWLMFCTGSADEFGPHEVFTPVIRIYKSLQVYDSSYNPLAFKIALCGPLERIELIILPISYFVTITYIIIFCVWVYCRGAHSFSVF
jgi:hypothetical protein